MGRSKPYKANLQILDKFPIRCPHGNCESSKEFPTLKSMQMHYRNKHKNNVTFKQLEEILMSDNEKEKTKEEQKTQEQSGQKSQLADGPKPEKTPAPIDIDKLIKRIDALDQKIPSNLCEEFPNLCKLGGQVENLGKDVADLKSKTLSKLVVKVPKQDDPPKVDTSVLEAKVNQLGDSLTDLRGEIGDQFKKLDEKSKEEKTKETITEVETEEPKPEPHKAPVDVENVTATVNRLLSGIHHTSAEKIVNCPECREKIMKELVKEAKTNTGSLDKLVSEVKSAFDKIAEGVNKGATNESKETKEQGGSQETAGNDHGVGGQSGQLSETNNSPVNSEERIDSGRGTVERTAGSQTQGTDSNAPQSASISNTELPEQPITETDGKQASQPVVNQSSTGDTEERCITGPDGRRICRLFRRRREAAVKSAESAK